MTQLHLNSLLDDNIIIFLLLLLLRIHLVGTRMTHKCSQRY